MANKLRQAARCLAVLALVFHVVWLPVHLLTVAHCDSAPAHQHHAGAEADHHDHSHGDPASHDDGDADPHHFTSDHESQFLAKRHALLFAPPLVVWQLTGLPPTLPVTRELPMRADPAPPPADSPPPSGPRAPPLA